MTAQNSGRLFSDPKYRKLPDEYSNILEKIVLPAARKYGLDKSALICEDLGEVTRPTEETMKKLDLSGIAVTQFDYRGADTPARNVIMIGSHDNQSFLEFVENFFKNTKSKHFYDKTRMLAEDTAPKDASKNAIKHLEHEIRTDKKKFIASSFAELFTSPARRVQIFFADFWGIPRTYNRPGTTEGNWTLRIGENFEKDYYEAVSKGNAPNLADAVATALRQRGLDKTHKKLVEDLDKSAKILAEA
jgi:4-alpha-glucanotransferase